MAKINFIYRGQKDVGNLSIRLIDGKDIDYRISTPIKSKKEYWFKRTTKNGKTKKVHIHFDDLPSNSTADLKKHKEDLTKVSKDILDLFIKDNNNGEPITKQWLKNAVEVCSVILDTKNKIIKVSKTREEIAQAKKNREDYIKSENLLSNAIQKMFVKYKTNFNELKKYKVTHGLLLKYQASTKTEYQIRELNQNFADNFINWAELEMKYSKSYINSQLKRFRSSAVYAYENDENDIILISKKLKSFKLIKDVYKGKIVVTLNYEELDRIDRTNIEDANLLDAKKAILIGCETGLRYSDQNKLIDTNIKNIDGVNYWKFRTQKTDSIVQITITERILYLIKTYGLPQTNYPADGVKLNKDIKKVCKIAGLTEEIKAKKAKVLTINNKQETRNITDLVPKYSAITTRTFRRSFATNYFGKIDTSLITSITGHSTEKQLRAYINVGDETNIVRTKEQIDNFHKERKEKKNNIKLTVIPKTISQ